MWMGSKGSRAMTTRVDPARRPCAGGGPGGGPLENHRLQDGIDVDGFEGFEGDDD